MLAAMRRNAAHYAGRDTDERSSSGVKAMFADLGGLAAHAKTARSAKIFRRASGAAICEPQISLPMPARHDATESVAKPNASHDRLAAELQIF